MAVNTEVFSTISEKLQQAGVTLVAVSKTKPVADIQELYHLGHRDFGENYVQELVEKQKVLPNDIRWHFIGHLQSNKVKQIAPFIHLIHGVDSMKLLMEINKQGINNQRVIQCLLQVHIAEEATKFGFDTTEIPTFFAAKELPMLQNVLIKGMMGMASFTENEQQVKDEFNHLQQCFLSAQTTIEQNVDITTLSMGMSGDYALAIAAGSNMVRIGSMLFGIRTPTAKTPENS